MSISTQTDSADPRVQQPAPAAVAAPCLDLSDVTLQYKTEKSLVTATHRVSFQAWPGERTVLLGPSGCGKSTLLKAIGGYLHPVEGSIRLDGRTIDRPGPERMMVFQEFDQLFPWKTVKHNIMFPLISAKRMSRKAAALKADDYIERVHLSRFRDAYPHTLSGGMKQRVAIARALAMEPRLLLMDEPFAALDALTRRKMQEELLELWAAIKCNMVFVTHSIDEAIIVGSRIVVLSPHPGRVRAEINCGQFGLSSESEPGFATLRERINRMLFG